MTYVLTSKMFNQADGTATLIREDTAELVREKHSQQPAGQPCTRARPDPVAAYATVEALQLNRPELVHLRRLLYAAGEPPILKPRMLNKA